MEAISEGIAKGIEAEGRGKRWPEETNRTRRRKRTKNLARAGGLSALTLRSPCGESPCAMACSEL
eukprot:scaffold279932_cov28-Tisochrysis_lutea.AAC.1